MHLPAGSGGEVIEVIGLLRRQAATLRSLAERVHLPPFLLFATGSNRPIADVQ